MSRLLKHMGFEYIWEIEDLKSFKNIEHAYDFMREKELHLSHNMYSFDLYYLPQVQKDHQWKVSVQGNTVEDSIEILMKLKDYLMEKGIIFKAATKTRFDYGKRYKPEDSERVKNQHIEQSKKAMTIYCPNEMNILDLAEDIKNLLTDYKGYEGVKDPSSYEKFSDGIYIRKDIDENGRYIHPN